MTEEEKKEIVDAAIARINANTQAVEDLPTSDNLSDFTTLPVLGSDGSMKKLRADRLKGAKGDALTFDQLTEDQKAQLKGPKGDKMTFADLTSEEKAQLKGEKGDALTFSMLTDEQKAQLKGQKGETGATGPQGPQGIKGDTGAQGLRGPKGDTGPQGEKGDKGDDGTSIKILGTKASNTELPPSGNTAGDAYLVNGSLHVWNGSAWIDCGNIQGPKGEKGDTGAQGPQGVAGPKGETGPQGPKGDTGPQGIQGIKGDKGDKGDAGAQGSKGDKGDKGDTGASVDTVNVSTLPSGSPATASLSADHKTLTLGIPKGDALTFDQLTESQKAQLKGPKGDKMTFADLTDADKTDLATYNGMPILSIIDGNSDWKITLQPNHFHKIKFTKGEFSIVLQAPQSNNKVVDYDGEITIGTVVPTLNWDSNIVWVSDIPVLTASTRYEFSIRYDGDKYYMVMV